MKTKFLLSAFWSKDLTKHCVVCKETLQTPFKVYSKKEITEFFSNSWWSKGRVKNQKVKWKIDWTTAVCEECLFHDQMKKLIKESKNG